jgi:hypothetical protein
MTRRCPICSSELEGLRRDATYCGSACRVEASRRRRREGASADGFGDASSYLGPQRRADQVAGSAHAGTSATSVTGKPPDPNLARIGEGGCGQVFRVAVTERVAAALEHAGRTHRELAEIAYSTAKPTEAQLSATRRATARLVDAGRAERGRRSSGAVEIHRPLTAAQREAQHEARLKAVRPFLERLEARRRATPYPLDIGFEGIVTVPVEPVLRITERGVELRESLEETEA